jgi:cold-inducible RNA-binding protein
LKSVICHWQKEYHMGTKLYVGNLSFQTQEFDLRDHFSPHGEVVSADIVTDRDTGRSRGFGFVEMSNDEEAQAAQSALDGQELDGRQLKINEAKPRTDNRRSGGGGGGYGGGGRNYR